MLSIARRPVRLGLVRQGSIDDLEAQLIRGPTGPGSMGQRTFLAITAGSTLRIEKERATFMGTDIGTKSRNGAGSRAGTVNLYWIPLGAGAHVVRLSGRLFEAISAGMQRRPKRDLYHSALEIVVPAGRFVIEMTPIPDAHGERRGVVVEGAVGATIAGRLRLFRYEIRRWRDGVIPDVSSAVSSPTRITDELTLASRILDLVPSVPALVWGRDELHTGDMWNSNSVTSWLLARAGIDTGELRPPSRGRAPGWRAGLVIATARSSLTVAS